MLLFYRIYFCSSLKAFYLRVKFIDMKKIYLSILLIAFFCNANAQWNWLYTRDYGLAEYGEKIVFDEDSSFCVLSYASSSQCCYGYHLTKFDVNKNFLWEKTI